MQLSCGLIVFGSVLSAAFAQNVVQVDPSQVRQTLAPTFHGVNYVGFWDGAQGSSGSAQALAQTATKLVRFPGGDPGDWYNFQCPYYGGDAQTPVCPAAADAHSWSSTSPIDLWKYAQTFGGTALFQTNAQGNGPKAPGTGWAANDPRQAGAYAQWAKDNSVSAIFEIGNEEDIKMTSVHDANFQWYVDLFKTQAAAIKAVDSRMQVIGPAGTNEYFWWALDSLGMFLHQTGNKAGTGQLDGVSLHFYRTGSSYNAVKDVPQSWEKTGGPWEFIKGSIASNDTRPLPVYITEWHIGDAVGSLNASIGNALVTADMIGVFAESGVASHEFFTSHSAAISSNAYGFLYGLNEARPLDSPAPAFYALALWKQMGSQVLQVIQNADRSSVMSTYATGKPDGTLQLMAINKTASAQDLQLNVSGQDLTGKHVDIYTLSSSNGHDDAFDAVYNGVQNPAVSQLPAPSAQVISASALTYSVPAYSVVVLNVGGVSGIPPVVAPTPPPTPPAVPQPPVAPAPPGHDPTGSGPAAVVTVPSTANGTVGCQATGGIPVVYLLVAGMGILLRRRGVA